MSNTTAAEEEKRRQEELASARNDVYSKQNSLSGKESQRRTNEGKITRLKAVKSTLETEKANAEAGHKKMKNFAENPDNFSDWFGEKRTRTQEVFNNNIIPEYDKYVDRIDDALDAVSNEITRLQNENYRLDSDIGWLKSAINSLWNKIYTLTN